MSQILRRLSFFLALLTLLSLVSPAAIAGARESVGARPNPAAGAADAGAAALSVMPRPAPLKAAPRVETPVSRLSVQVAVTPTTLRVGDEATVTVTVTNPSREPATNVVLTLPVPDGATPVAQEGVHTDAGGWKWMFGTMAGGSSKVVQARLRLTKEPAGQALLARAEVTAHELAQPVQGTGGAMVTGPAVAQEASTPLAAGKAATLRSADGHVDVVVPAGASDTDLRLSHRSADAVRQRDAKAQLPPDVAGFKRGLGTFVLDATDGKGRAVHKFRQPVTINVRYTPEQLAVLGISEADLTLFWFDEQAHRWIGQPTAVDSVNRVASAQVDHFSGFQLSDGSAPSEAFVPSVQGWQVGLYSGNATFSFPIEVPAGPGGIKPDLQLSYNSAATDGKAGMRLKQQAGWVGKGWTMDTGTISANKLAVGQIPYYSLVLNGQSFDLVRAEPLANHTGPNDIDPTHYAWRTTDESFIKVRIVEAGDSTPERGGFHRSGEKLLPYKRHMWQVWKKDGTRYEFRWDRWWGFDDCQPQGGYAEMETYMWHLSEVVDTHGNTISYSYDHDSQKKNPVCLSVQGVVDRDVWPKTITWGATPTIPDPKKRTIDRYKVEFESSLRDPSNRYNPQLDAAFEGAGNQYGGENGKPRETQILDRIRVLSMQGTSWELVRQYNLRHDFSLLSDHTVSGTTNPDTNHRKLTLTSIEQLGNDGSSLLRKMTFTYGRDRDENPAHPKRYPKGDWNRLTKVDNGQGGTISFEYDTIANTVPQEWRHEWAWFANNRRVTSKTLSDGRGNNYTWRYAYTGAAVNWLESRTTNGARKPVNSAVLYYNKYRQDRDYRALLLHKEFSEFRGHSAVVETDPNGNQTEHSYIQGDVGCDPTLTGGKLDDENQIATEQCFKKLRAQEFHKGKEYRTVVKSGNGTVLTEDQHAFETGPVTYGPAPLAGLWRAFGYESQTVNTIWEGTTTPITKKTEFGYDPALQGGEQFGNLTHQREYTGSTLYRQREYRYATLNTPTSYMVDRRIAEGVKDGARALLALTNYAYDYNTIPWGTLSKGDLTLVRKYYDITPGYVHGTTTIHSADTSYGYDEYGNQTEVITYAAAGTRVGNTFSAPGNGSTPATTTTTYDDTFHVFPTKKTPPLVRVDLSEQADYDYKMGTLTKVIDANNNPTSAEYDEFGRMIKLIKPGDTPQLPTIEASYADGEKPFRYTIMKREISGNPTAVHTSSQFYDGLGRKIQAKSESRNGTQNVVTDMRYDGLGNTTAQSQPRFVNETSTTFGAYTPVPATGVLWTTTTYDPLSRPLVVTPPDNTRTVHHYNINNGMQSDDVTDPQRHRIQHRIDVFGRLAQVVEVKGTCGNYWGYTCSPGETQWAVDGTTTYEYSPLDLLTKVTDAKNNTTEMTYDSLGRKLTMKDPDMGAWSYGYDVNSNLTTQKDAKGQTITFGYDPLNRLTSKALPTGGIIRFGYDEDDEHHLNGHGQRTSMTDPSGSGAHHWAYTDRGEVSQEQVIVNGKPGAHLIGRTYFADGKPKTLTYPTGEVLTYQYNDARQQTSISTSLGGSYLSNAAYDPLGQPLTQNYSNGVTTTSTYEPLTKRLSATITNGPGGTALQHAYTYDAAGNVQTITNPLANETLQHTYDERDRLVGACAVANAQSTACLGGTTFNQSYSYDTIGNLTTKAGATYTYANGKPHAVSAVNGTAYTYDANGNMLTGAGRNYTWNAENQPNRITNGATTETYDYDGDNTRIKKITVNGGATTTTIYIGGLVEYTGNEVISHYEGIAVRRTTGNPSATNKGSLTYLHTDHLGSVSATTSGNAGSLGAVGQRQEFDPWGAVRSGGITATEHNYTGQRRDVGTGLLFYNARYYDPALARFISADSIVPGTSHRSLSVDFHETTFAMVLQGENAQGFWFEMNQQQRQKAQAPWGPGNPQELNRFSHVNNNPLRYTDPTGHTAFTAKQAGELGEQLWNMVHIIQQQIRDMANPASVATQMKNVLLTLVGSYEGEVGMFLAYMANYAYDVLVTYNSIEAMTLFTDLLAEIGKGLFRALGDGAEYVLMQFQSLGGGCGGSDTNCEFEGGASLRIFWDNGSYVIDGSKVSQRALDDFYMANVWRVIDDCRQPDQRSCQDPNGDRTRGGPKGTPQGPF